MFQFHEQQCPGATRILGRQLVMAFILTMSAGCGLSDYEAQMELEQNRLKYLDEENKHLEGVPVKLLQKKVDEKDPPPPEIFFRPPKGVATTAEPKPIGIMSRFVASNNTGLQDLLVVVERTDKVEDFKKKVLQSLAAVGSEQDKEVGRPAGRLLRYKVVEPTNQPGLAVYFYVTESPYLVAIVFRKEGTAPSSASLKESIDFSLASLLVGGPAASKLASWKAPPAPSGPTGRGRIRRS